MREEFYGVSSAEESDADSVSIGNESESEGLLGTLKQRR